ncbi:MAG: hypothetical protein V1752_04145 [Candidatus Firestonebacteria bacterium]
MRILFIALFVCFLTSSVSSEIVQKKNVFPDGASEVSYYLNNFEVAVNKYDKEGKIISRRGRVPDGIVRKYYPDGKTEVEFTVKDGVADGEYKNFWKNGKMKDIWIYKNGVLDGECRSYADNGDLQYVLLYSNDQLVNEKNYSLINHKVRYEKVYSGKDIYIKKTFYGSGAVKTKGDYKKDSLDGEYLEYYSNGDISKKAFYKSGREISVENYSKDKPGLIIFVIFLFSLSTAVLVTVYLINKGVKGVSYDGNS